MLGKLLPRKFCALFEPHAREEKDKQSSNGHHERRLAEEDEPICMSTVEQLQTNLINVFRGLEQLDKQQDLKINHVCSKLDRVEVRMIEVQRELQDNGILKTEADMNGNRSSELDEKINEIASRVNQLISKERKLDKFIRRVDGLEDWLLHIEKTVNSSKDGTLIWKVENFSELISKDVPLLSDFIYTGQYGYKLQAVIHPNGIASGLGTHLSLYIAIHKGEHDAILHWPFQGRVYFTLMDQHDDAKQRINKSEKLVCDRKSSSFSRPEADMNPGWGFPKFISLHMLKTETFIKDDCFFLKVEVESEVD